jgi:hypothetical protein
MADARSYETRRGDVKDRKALLAAASLEMKDRTQETITMQYTAPQAMGLLGTLQLALRHPANRGATSTQMRLLAHTLEQWLSEFGPAIKELCQLGWNPEADDDAGA